MFPRASGWTSMTLPSDTRPRGHPWWSSPERNTAAAPPGTGGARGVEGKLLLGIRAAIAETYERIQRSNLLGMGVLPLQFKPGQNAESLGLAGKERLTITGISGKLTPRQDVTVEVERPDGTKTSFVATARL